jgi:uncharacterized repeat protein (TIGR01451 family)
MKNASLILGFLLGIALLHTNGEAQISLSINSDLNLHLSSAAPCGPASPRATYVAVQINNTSGTVQTNIVATLAGLTNGYTLAGGQAATQRIGSIPAGQSRVVFWFVGYPCTINTTTNPTVTIAGSASASITLPMQTLSSDAHNFGGLIIGSSVSPGAVIGQTIFTDVEYQFGNINPGDTHSLQPAGNQNFNAQCFQLVGSQVIASIIGGITTGTTNRTVFTASTRHTGNGHTVTMRWFFRYQCTATTSSIKPYATLTSGTTLRHTNNYEAYVGPNFPAATNPFTVTKTANRTIIPTGERVQYTVSIHNSSAFTSRIDSIHDVLPNGATYVGMLTGDITAANSSRTPVPGSTGILRWAGNYGTSYNINPGQTIQLRYEVDIPSIAGNYNNVATTFVGIQSVGNNNHLIQVGADIAVYLSGPSGSIPAGDTLTFEIRTENAGPAQGTDVVINLHLPDQLEYISSTGGTLSGNTVTWPTIPTFNVGTIRTDTIRAVIGSNGTFTTYAFSTASSIDPNEENNDGSADQSRLTITVFEIGVLVTPKHTTNPYPRLPGEYSQNFFVQSQSSQTRGYQVAALAGPAGTPFIQPDSIGANGLTPSGPLSGEVTLTSGDSVQITVWYQIPQGTSATQELQLQANVTSEPSINDQGQVILRRISPTIDLNRSYEANNGVMPNEEIEYTITAENSGEADAIEITLVEEIAPDTDFKIGSIQTFPSSGAIEYSNDGIDWTLTPSDEGCGAPIGFDRCIRWIRWTPTEPLLHSSGNSVTIFFITRIR